VNWSRPTDSGSTENARLENRKLFQILFKLLYLRFPPLQIRTCFFRTCIFHPCIFVLTYSVLAYSILRYFRFPYVRFQSPPPIKICPRYGLVRSARTVSTVTHGRLYGRPERYKYSCQIKSCNSLLQALGGDTARYSQLVRPLRSAPTVSTVSLTVREFCSRSKNPYGQYGQHGHAPGQPTVYTVT